MAMRSATSGELLQQLQNEVLEAIATGATLHQVAELVCRRAERLAPDAICSILAVHAQGILRPLAAPSLPPEYSRALDGLAVGPSVGSCGTTAWRGEPIEVHDIWSDPLWADYRHLGVPSGLRACWSSPIKARDGRVVGTFAFYFRQARGPAEMERAIVATCVHLCAIAIEHDEAQARIQQLAYYDLVTGLPNRILFRERAEGMLATLRDGEVLNLLHVDLDDFQGINDTLGNRIGDLLLERVARRFCNCRFCGCDVERMLLARYCGDEFSLVQIVPAGRAGAAPLAQALIDALDEPFEVDGHRLSIGANVGIAQASRADTDFAELSRRADLALCAAKAEGAGAYCFFAPEMDAATRSRRHLKQDLRQAIDAGEFTLTYQPIVALSSGELVAVEALLRWHHHARGNVSPAQFIPVIEEMGLIGALGHWVLHEACSTAAAWPRPLKVGVNLSPLQFRRPGLVTDVLEVLQQTGLPPERLALEVTESALLSRDVATRIALNQLHDHGVSLSLDDFGTGFSSLQSLRSFPFDRLKIDMSFVRGLGIDKDAIAIVHAVIGLARDLCIGTVAEGIENASQLEWLARHGCGEGQGYYLSEPLDGAALHALLERPERLAALRRRAVAECVAG
jgi:diguanylate cyclase (GGDEF)-like protein